MPWEAIAELQEHERSVDRRLRRWTRIVLGLVAVVAVAVVLGFLALSRANDVKASSARRSDEVLAAAIYDNCVRINKVIQGTHDFLALRLPDDVRNDILDDWDRLNPQAAC